MFDYHHLVHIKTEYQAMPKPFYFLFALSIILVTCHANTSTSACAPSNCGNLSIRYPFWNKYNNTTNGEVCGYSDFGLECYENKAIMTMPSNLYYVTDINYNDSSITLVDIDVVDQPCPRARHNVSLQNLPSFSLSQLDLPLSFYFNCSFQPSSVQQIECMTSGRNQSYVFTSGDEDDSAYGGDLRRQCQDHVVVIVKQDEIENGDLLNGFGGAMQKGFVLDWNSAGNCAECEQYGGNCRFNTTSKQSSCICNDGRIGSKTCKIAHVGVSLRRKIIQVAASAVIGGLLCCIVICCRKRMPSSNFGCMIRNDHDIEAFLKNHEALAQRRYKFSEVKKMTNSFKVKLGEGGFGAVYKGKLHSGCHVAVKMLNASKGKGEDFINEVASISRTCHVNVVTLLGFCLEGQKKALIYEFMVNGSLDKFIYNKGLETTPSLSWDQLWQIAVGIGRGLEYLHRGCNTRILHFDIKPHNILLDEKFCPKISDFGLAKLCPRNESIISMSDARGTIGYVAPEVWNKHIGGISHKSDVYSYGMMLLEMVGMKNINAEVSHTSEMYFPDWIYNRLEQGVDLRTSGVTGTEENEIVRRMTVVGLWCVQTFPKDRPTMSRVIDMLEGNVNSLEMPPKPVLSSPTRSVPKSTTGSSQFG